MKRILILCCVAVLSFPYAISTVSAQETQAVKTNIVTETVQMVTDQDKGTITFIIDGKAVVQINRDGLHVVESINYGGTLTDSGSAHVEKIIKAGGENEE